MPTSQVRFYQTEKQAHEASQKLRESGFAAESIVVVTPGQGEVSSVSQVGVPTSNVPALAKRVRDGGESLVAISVPYGRGVVAAAVLDEFQPNEGQAPVASHMPSGRATPLSDFLGLPVLTKRRVFFGSGD
ncbi:MAG: hypothetical protein AAFX85_10740 [Pseudomonadota bacterium]